MFVLRTNGMKTVVTLLLCVTGMKRKKVLTLNNQLTFILISITHLKHNFH